MNQTIFFEFFGLQFNAGVTCWLQIKLPSGSYLTVDQFDWGISIFFATTELDGSRGLCRELKGTENDKLLRLEIEKPGNYQSKFAVYHLGSDSQIINLS